jgi:uncharacterized membrane protein
MIHAMKTLHLLFVLTFLGLFIANYYYTSISLYTKQQDFSTVCTTLKCSFIIDCFLSIGIISIPSTCLMLMHTLHISMQLPWIALAFMLGGFSSLAWMGIVVIKCIEYSKIRANKARSRQLMVLFHLLNIVVLGCLLWTMRDAVIQGTLLQTLQTSVALIAYNAVKIIHIISACILFGTGLGTAAQMSYTRCVRSTQIISDILKRVVTADWLFTTPSGIIQAITGLTLMHLRGYSFSDLWIMGSVAGYVLAGACWVPVVYLQIACKNMAIAASQTNTPLPKRYYQYFLAWVILGIPAFLALIAVIYFMCQKPNSLHAIVFYNFG